MNRKQASSFTTGLMFVVVGLILLSSQLHLWPGGMGSMWPLIFFVIGVGHIARAEGEGRWRAGLWWFFLGSLFLLHTTHTLTLHDSWPLFIVWFGVSLLMGRNCDNPRDRRRSMPPDPPASPSTPDIVVPRQP